VTISVASAPAGSIASDDFESRGFTGGAGAWVGGWTRSGDAALLTNTDGPHSGTSHVRLRGNSGYLSRRVDLSGRTNVKLRVWLKARSFEYADQAWVRVSPDGVNYTTVLTLGDGDDDDRYHQYEIDLGSFAMTSGFEIVFDAQMSGWWWGWSDYLFVDDVELVSGGGQAAASGGPAPGFAGTTEGVAPVAVSGTSSPAPAGTPAAVGGGSPQPGEGAGDEPETAPVGGSDAGSGDGGTPSAPSAPPVPKTGGPGDAPANPADEKDEDDVDPVDATKENGALGGGPKWK
jgi:hypothetical protein